MKCFEPIMNEKCMTKQKMKMNKSEDVMGYTFKNLKKM